MRAYRSRNQYLIKFASVENIMQQSDHQIGGKVVTTDEQGEEGDTIIN
jgi:hypothetical protein